MSRSEQRMFVYTAAVWLVAFLGLGGDFVVG